MTLKKYPLAILLSSLAACSSNGSLPLSAYSPGQSSDPISDQFYNVMAAEMYSGIGDDKKSIEHYLLVAMLNDDPAIAKRATQVASRSGQNEKAIQAAKRWLELAPKSLEARQYLALLLLRERKFKESAQALHDVQTSLDVKGKDGIEIVASVLAQENKHEAVYQMYKEYSLLEPTSAKVKLILASLAFKAKHYDSALSIVTPITTLLEGETKEQALLLKSKVLSKLERGDEAMLVLSPLMQSESTTDVALLEYVRILILDKRNEEAAEVLARLSAKHPENFEIMKALIALYLDLKEYAQAEQYIPNLLSSDKYVGVAHHFQAEIFESRHELDAALGEYQQVTSGELLESAHNRIPTLLMQQHGLDMTREWIHQQISTSKVEGIKSKFLVMEATLLLEQGDYETALKLYNEADVLAPNNINLYYSRAITLQHLKEYEKAESDFLSVLKRHKNDINTLNAYGHMLSSHTNRFDEAESLITKALSLRPEDEMIIDSLGWLYYRKGNAQQAEIYLQQAYEKSSDPEIASHLIEVLTKLGKKEEALAIFKDMIEQYPNDDQLKRVKKKIIDYNRKSSG